MTMPVGQVPDLPSGLYAEQARYYGRTRPLHSTPMTMPVGQVPDLPSGFILVSFKNIALSTTPTRKTLDYFIAKESRCSANGERDRPEGTILVIVTERVCVRWMSIGT
jgi:hypothetical protein